MECFQLGCLAGDINKPMSTCWGRWPSPPSPRSGGSACKDHGGEGEGEEANGQSGNRVSGIKSTQEQGRGGPVPRDKLNRGRQRRSIARPVEVPPGTTIDLEKLHKLTQP